MIFCYTHWWMPYSSIMRNASSYSRGEQTHSKCYTETLKHTALNGTFPSNASTQSSGKWSEEEAEKCKSQREWRTTGKQGPLKKLSKAHMDSETKAASTGTTWVCTRPSVYIVKFWFSIYMRFLSVWMSRSLIVVTSLRLFSLCQFALSNSVIMVFSFILVYVNLLCSVVISEKPVLF